MCILFSSDLAQTTDSSTYTQDNIKDNQSPSQDSNLDSSDRTSSYDLSSSPDVRDEESGESGSLPPPNELSVIRLNDTSVVLRWEFPESAQEHLQFFKIQYRPTRTKESNWKTEMAEILPTIRAYQINGLRPGNFQFIVSAVYDNDDNVPSTPPLKYRIRAKSKIKPEEMPEMKAPQIYWWEAKHDYFRFKWKYEPKEQDHDIFGYLVYYRSAHIVSDYFIYNTMDSNVEVADVEPDTPYEAKVVAYNTVGVSEFSDTITIRTETQPNSTASTVPTNQPPSSVSTSTIPPMPPTTTTRRPLTVSWPPNSRDTFTSTQAPFDGHPTVGPKFNISTSPPGIIESSNSSNTMKEVYRSFIKSFNAVIGDQSDAMLIIRYLLLVLLPIIFIISVLTCLVKGPKLSKKQAESTPSTTDNSMQFHLEINGYFKNSFPGVDKEYSSVTGHDEVHPGFVNNHPHSDEFA